MVEMNDKSVTLNLDRRTISLRGVKGSKNDKRLALSNGGDPGETSADFSAFIFELSCPILFSTDLLNVIEGPDFRIFPPIQLQGGRSPSIQAEHAYVPCGSGIIDWARSIDYSSCSGFVYSIGQTKEIPVFRGYGLRIDTAGDLNRANEIKSKFLQSVRSLSLQWWLQGGKNPFDLGHRFMSNVSQDGNLSDICDSDQPKYPMQSQAILSGIEKVIGQPHWKYLMGQAHDEFPADQPISLLCDALEKFYDFNDSSALLNAALSIESAEYEIRKTKKIDIYTDPIRNIKKNPQYLKYGDPDILKDLFIDRGHVAHAQAPPKLNSGARSIQEYLIQAVKIAFARSLHQKGELGKDLQVFSEGG